MPESSHRLLVNLGTGAYQRTTYTFPGGMEVATSVAGLALWKWLEATGRPPASVLIACTGLAWHARESLVRDQMTELGLPANRLAPIVELGIPRDLQAVWRLLPPIESWLTETSCGRSQGAVLHIDLTHAYRAIPLAHTWMALLLHRRGVAAPGVWGYGAFDPATPDRTPYLDLSHLVELAEWATAIQDFRCRFDTHRLGELLRRSERQNSAALAMDGRLGPEEIAARRPLRCLFKAAEQAGEAFAVGLPIEVGLGVSEALGRTTIDDVRAGGSRWLPGLVPVLELLFEELSPLAAGQGRSSGQAKKGVALTRAEIDRQYCIVLLWRRGGAVGDALQALRELMVNRVLLARAVPGTAPRWLDREVRESAEALLNAVRPPRRGEAHSAGNRPLGVRKIGRLWDEICSARNSFAHAGMQEDFVSPEHRRERFDQLAQSFERIVWAQPPDVDWSLQGVEASSGKPS